MSRPGTGAKNSKQYQFFPQTNIPGYAGFIPLRLFDCGQTFGRAASPAIRTSAVHNMKEKYYRTGPAFLEDTLAAAQAREASRQMGTQNSSSAARRCEDGNIAVPRYHSTFEKPGYAGHVPMHVEDALKNQGQLPAKTFLRNVPGYTGIVPGARTRVGETFGKLATRKRVNTPQKIAGSRLLFSAHGSFRPAGESRARTPVTPPWATEDVPMPMRSRPATGFSQQSRPVTGESRPVTGESRPATGEHWSSRPNTQSQIEVISDHGS
eukprot:TRINITY_DN15369_c0_g1_i2.p1 TRINITY_DN15369_c0_g1~~TRINITY_DN15369_c0_g1_i2.p1  ORF type:complete len:266 (-),score=26.69 TRINITY_DN15369_c0_g1_i2:323-1120(-)